MLRIDQLTPEQIGLDYEALLELIGKKRVIEMIGVKRVIEIIGEEFIRQWLARQCEPPVIVAAPPPAEP
jgi:hypothetical protein